MAARIANALERGIHYRRALFWSLQRTMEAGALGCEILLKGKLRSDRGRYEKVTAGYIPKAGDPAQRYVKSAVIHVKQKKGTIGCTVTIVPPDAKFPDKVDLSGLPDIEYPEEEIILPLGVEPDVVEGEEIVGEETAEPIEALEPTTAIDSLEEEVDATPAEEASEVVESVEVLEPAVETSAEASEPEIEIQAEETEAAVTLEDVVADAPSVTEEPEAVVEVPEVEVPVVEESTPVEEVPEVEAVETPEEPGATEPDEAPESSDDSEAKTEE